MKSFKILVMFFAFSSICYAEFLPQSFVSKFEQEYISTLKGKVKKGQGTIEYKYPGNIRFETNTPSSVVFVSNGVKSWYYRAPFIEGEEGEVTESSAKEGSSVYIKFFDSLKNGLVNNDYYSVVQKSDNVVLSFKPKAIKELSIKESSISFKSKSGMSFDNIEAIELTFQDGKKSKLKFVELKVNPAMGADRFNFTPPANTKKIN